MSMIKRNHTFTIDHYSEIEKKKFEGKFTMHVANFAEKTKINVRTSQILGGMYCFPPGTMVLGDEVRPIETIEIGDLVYGHDGMLHTVTELFERKYEGSLIRLTTRGTFPVLCTPDHQFLVVRPYKRTGGSVVKPAAASESHTATTHYEKQPVWIKASEIQLDDYLIMPRIQIKNTSPLRPEWLWRSASSTTARQLCDRLEPSVDLAWLLGLFVADGSTTENGTESIITLGLEDDYERAATVFRSLGANPRVVVFDNHVRVCVKSRTLTRSFREWFGTESYVKQIPSFLYHGWDLAHVLDGIIAGDGCIDEESKMTKVSTTSRVLALQVAQIAQSLGEFPTIYAPRRLSGYANARQLYEVVWCGEKDGNHRNIRLGNNYGVKVLKTDKTHYNGSVFNIEVADVHSYLTEGVVAHNCVRDDEGNPTGRGVDPVSEHSARMLAWLDIVLIQKPEWFKLDDPDAGIIDEDVIFKVFSEVMKYERTFRGDVGQTTEGENGSAQSGEGIGAPQPAQAVPGNRPTQVVGREVQAALDP